MTLHLPPAAAAQDSISQVSVLQHTCNHRLQRRLTPSRCIAELRSVNGMCNVSAWNQIWTAIVESTGQTWLRGMRDSICCRVMRWTTTVHPHALPRLSILDMAVPKVPVWRRIFCCSQMPGCSTLLSAPLHSTKGQNQRIQHVDVFSGVHGVARWTVMAQTVCMLINDCCRCAC